MKEDLGGSALMLSMYFLTQNGFDLLQTSLYLSLYDLDSDPLLYSIFLDSPWFILIVEHEREPTCLPFGISYQYGPQDNTETLLSLSCLKYIFWHIQEIFQWWHNFLLTVE